MFWFMSCWKTHPQLLFSVLAEGKEVLIYNFMIHDLGPLAEKLFQSIIFPPPWFCSLQTQQLKLVISRISFDGSGHVIHIMPGERTVWITLYLMFHFCFLHRLIRLRVWIGLKYSIANFISDIKTSWDQWLDPVLGTPGLDFELQFRIFDLLKEN